VELERRVTGDDGVVRELRGKQNGIDRVARRIAAARHGCMEPPPQVQQPARRDVLLDHRGAGLPAPASAPRAGRHELLVA